MHFETNIDRHGENPNLGMQSWIEKNEIERHGEYCVWCDIEPYSKSIWTCYWIEILKHAKKINNNKNNLNLTC